ncbi:hypothetical protein KIPB_013359, partial [Kipferlia bialata]|eukprot:g13359.t1
MSDNKLKLVLLGASRSGKTCLVRRRVENAFDSDQYTTVGASYERHDVTVRGQ